MFGACFVLYSRQTFHAAVANFLRIRGGTGFCFQRLSLATFAIQHLRGHVDQNLQALHMPVPGPESSYVNHEYSFSALDKGNSY